MEHISADGRPTVVLITARMKKCTVQKYPPNSKFRKVSVNMIYYLGFLGTLITKINIYEK